jgi:3-hydroxybutyryl-CoA dehydrogenase
MNIQKIGVIGAGTMGDGIAQVAAQKGFEFVLQDVEEELAIAGFSKKKDVADKIGETHVAIMIIPILKKEIYDK